MQKLYEPRVLGAGIIIDRTPTEPKHGVRKVDLEAYTQIQTYDIEGVTRVEIPMISQQYMVHVVDEQNQFTWPDLMRELQTPARLEITFLAPQSGTIRVLFVGGTGGD